MKKLIVAILLLFIVSKSFSQGLGDGPIAQTKGILYSKSTYSAVTDFTATGITPTISGTAIRLPAGASNFSQTLDLTGFINTDENVEMEVNFTIRTATSGTAYGIGIGKRSTNVYFPNTTLAQCSMLTGGTSGLFLGNAVAAISSVTDATLGTFSLNDVVILKFKQYKNNISCYVENVTTGYKNSTFYKDLLDNPGTITGRLPTTSNFCIWQIGTQIIDINSVKVTSFQPINKPLWFLGDSKTHGYAALSPEARFCELLGGNIYAAGGDRTVELITSIPYFLKLNPRGIVILEIGSNDLRSSVVTGTWQANYASIVSQLTAAGLTVYHMVIPETTLNQSALTTYIQTTYGQNKMIDMTGFVVSTMCSADAVHPNIVGNKFIADKIKMSGLIK